MTKKLHLHDNTLYYSRVGSGPVVLFLHGFLGDSSVWNSVISSLKDEFTCISIDLPDHGRSQMHSAEYTFESLVLSISSIMELEELSSFHIVGHSMGGYVGLSLAQLKTNQVLSLTLVNSTAFADSDQKKVERDRACRVFDLNPKVYIKAAITNLVYHKNHSKLEDEIKNLVCIAMQLSPAGAKAALCAMRDRKDYVSFLEKTQIPINMISGKYDTVCPLDKAIQQLENVKACHLILEHSGHMAYVEEPQKLLSGLKEFLTTS